jgi:hypothetical protein
LLGGWVSEWVVHMRKGVKGRRRVSKRYHASTFQYRRMESNIFKKLAKQPDDRLLQKHGSVVEW